MSAARPPEARQAKPTPSDPRPAAQRRFGRHPRPGKPANLLGDLAVGYVRPAQDALAVEIVQSAPAEGLGQPQAREPE
jgi:hypothetical protein